MKLIMPPLAMKLVRPQPTFKINDVPVYGTLNCSASSPTVLDSLDSFDYCNEQGLGFQSAGHAVVVRKAFFDDAKGDKKINLDNSNEYQKLGTLALAYRDGSQIVRVFSELDMSDESRALLENGVKVNARGGELFLPLNDSLVARLVSSGRRTRPLESDTLRLSTEEKVGGSDYSMSEFNSALFGSQQLAEVNASYLRARGKPVGFSYDYTRAQLEDMLKEKEVMVHVRPCSLGGDDYDYIDYVYASGNFYVQGRSRGTSTNS